MECNACGQRENRGLCALPRNWKCVECGTDKGSQKDGGKHDGPNGSQTLCARCGVRHRLSKPSKKSSVTQPNETSKKSRVTRPEETNGEMSVKLEKQVDALECQVKMLECQVNMLEKRLEKIESLNEEIEVGSV